MDLNSKQKGNLTELQCLTAFCEKGILVSIPYGDCARYDFIADYQGQLLRVQCKTCQVVDDGEAIQFSGRSTQNSTIHRQYDKSQIDYFCTYFNNQCYLIPVEECSSYKKLRFVPPKNNQRVGINYAKDYELESQLSKITKG